MLRKIIGILIITLIAAIPAKFIAPDSVFLCVSFFWFGVLFALISIGFRSDIVIKDKN